MAKRKKKTLEEKYVELLEAQVEILDKMVQVQERLIDKLDTEPQITTTPWQMPPISIPSTWCAHEYPQMWGGTNPPNCTKCGATMFPYGHGSSGTITITNVPNGQQGVPGHVTIGGGSLGVDLTKLPAHNTIVANTSQPLSV